MLNRLMAEIELTVYAENARPRPRWSGAVRAAACAIALAALATACNTPPPGHSPASDAAAPSALAAEQSTNSAKPLVLQEGDTLKIDFPGAPTLDTVQAIRRDGRITLAQIGEYDAAGKSPAAVEADLKRLYGSVLVNSDVTVTVQSSAFTVYVIGSVARPGKIISDRPLNVLEALIEAGFDNRSNLRSVWVLRIDSHGHIERTKINLNRVVYGKATELPAFTLKPNDIISVSERFNLF